MVRPIAQAELLGIFDLAAKAGGAAAALAAVEAASARRFGHLLLSVMLHHPGLGEVERLYSSTPSVFPIGGRKKRRDTPWGLQVLGRGEPFIGNGPEVIRATFADHALIAGCGVTAMLNMPAMLDGRCRGTLNIGRAAPFAAADLPAARLLAFALLPLLLAAAAPPLDPAPPP
ncbi:MAG: hypothetical protein OHK0024_23280 [Thalassobaculales bacterium]